MQIIPILVAAIVGLVGSGGVVFGALRYNRDEAGRIVDQQTAVLTDMRGLNDELQDAYERSTHELGLCRRQVAALTDEVMTLRRQVTRLTQIVRRYGIEPD